MLSTRPVNMWQSLTRVTICRSRRYDLPLTAYRFREKGDFQSEPLVASGRRPRRSPSANTYARASTWVRRRASAAEVAAARLLSLIMRLVLLAAQKQQDLRGWKKNQRRRRQQESAADAGWAVEAARRVRGGLVVEKELDFRLEGRSTCRRSLTACSGRPGSPAACRPRGVQVFELLVIHVKQLFIDHSWHPATTQWSRS